jgi:hypothetical protein
MRFGENRVRDCQQCSPPSVAFAEWTAANLLHAVNLYTAMSSAVSR